MCDINKLVVVVVVVVVVIAIHNKSRKKNSPNSKQKGGEGVIVGIALNHVNPFTAKGEFD